MDYIFLAQVVHGINKLTKEKSTSILSHSFWLLANIVKKSTVDVFLDNVDNIINNFSIWLDNLAVCAILDQSHNVSVAQRFLD